MSSKEKSDVQSSILSSVQKARQIRTIRDQIQTVNHILEQNPNIPVELDAKTRGLLNRLHEIMEYHENELCEDSRIIEIELDNLNIEAQKLVVDLQRILGNRRGKVPSLKDCVNNRRIG